MDELLTGWSRIAWAQCWQVTLLIAGVWLVLRLVGRDRPHLACALWLVVLLKCVTPPLVSSPSGIFCWLQRTEPVAGEETVLAAAKYAAPVEPDGDAIVVRASPVVAAPPLPLQNVPTSLTPAETHTPVQKPGWSWPTLLLAGALAWLAGTIIYAAVALARWHVCWRKLCRTRQIEDPRLAGLVAELCRRLAVRRKVRLLITESPLGPAVVGLVRPTIVLPAAIVREKLPAELAPLLAHELIHIRRGDLWIGLLQTLAVASWWFHPLVRLASRLVTREAERCCDEETIAHLGCDPAAYARSLLDVLALKQQLTPIPAFPVVRPVDVTSQRLERIMNLGQGYRASRTPWWCWLIMLAAAAAVLPGAALVAEGEAAETRSSSVALLGREFRSSGRGAARSRQEQVRREYDVGEVLRT
jgi:beta-lactamase regulating signal transducer with metallopeptidase domain